MKNEQPLVSIIVITYNSSNYVLETLESAKAQTYQNIELIISDDCSNDNTIKICEDWLKVNKTRFKRTKIITAPQNTGIPANCNRGLFASKGQWLKLIAGDDLLTNNSVTRFTDFVKNNEAKIVFGGCHAFKDSKEVGNELHLPPKDFISMDAKSQYRYLITEGNTMHGPTSFINRSALLELNGFDERIPFSEDWPLWIKLTKNNYKLFFIKEAVAFYRINSGGIYSENIGRNTKNIRLTKSINKVRKLYIIPGLLELNLYLRAWHEYLIIAKEESNLPISRLLIYLSPFAYRTALKNLLQVKTIN